MKKSIISLLTVTLTAITLSGCALAPVPDMTEEQEKLLLDNGCTYGQGFLFSRPMPNEKYIEFIEEHDCA